MAGFRPLQFPRNSRPFWLLVALAVVLLVSVAATAAASATMAASLLDVLARDMATLRLQVEELRPRRGDEEPGIGFNAEIGDGSAAFRWQAAAQRVRAAQRRAQKLAQAYRHETSEPRALIADGLALQIFEVAKHLDALQRAPDQSSEERARRDVEISLDRFDQLLASLRAPEAPLARTTPGTGAKSASDDVRIAPPVILRGAAGEASEPRPK